MEDFSVNLSETSLADGKVCIEIKSWKYNLDLNYFYKMLFFLLNKYFSVLFILKRYPAIFSRCKQFLISKKYSFSPTFMLIFKIIDGSTMQFPLFISNSSLSISHLKYNKLSIICNRLI